MVVISAALSLLFNYKPELSYCAGWFSPLACIHDTFSVLYGGLIQKTLVPGNANALSNSQALTSRGICSKYYMQEHSRYTEQFARKGDITIAKSLLFSMN
ncbi:MAG: hypothetical protein IPI68_11235 [Chitinophagaceae bacterium]|nr:hypothetical protein [Chitinophagaceae bacterium]